MKDQSEIQMTSINKKEKLLTSSNKTANNDNNNAYKLDNKSFYVIYLTMIGITLASNLEDGAIPSAFSLLKEDYYYEETKLGLIDTLTVLGKLISSIVIIVTMKKDKNHKNLFVICLLFKIISLLSSAFISSSFLFFISRFISGMSQAFFVIYFPVWIDQYYKGHTAQKPFLIALIQFCAPVSIMFGFAISTVFYLNWRYVFYIEALGLIISSGLIFLSSEGNYVKHNNNTVNSNTLTPEQSLYELRPPTKESLKKITKEPLFILLSVSIISSCFVFFAIKHWSTYYMIQHMEISDRGIRFCAFALVIYSGPIIGIVFGGITTSLIGGYEQKKAIAYCLLYHFIGYSFTWILFIYESNILFILSLWVLFFFNSASVIMEVGIIITAFPLPCKGDAFCFLNLLIYILGYLPSSLLYGALNESTKTVNNKSAILFTVQMNIISLIVLIVASVIRCFQQAPVYPNSKNRVTEIVAQGIGFIFNQYANSRNE